MKKFASTVVVLLLLLGLVGVGGIRSAYSVLEGVEVQITTDPNYQYEPQIDGTYIVWMDNRNDETSGTDIYLYNIETGIETPIANSPDDECLSDISGNLVVYTLSRWDDDDIFIYNTLTEETKQITDPENREFARRRNPAIDGNHVVWQDNRNGNYDIYCYDLETDTEFIVSRGIGEFPAPGDQIHPYIHGDLVVWEDYRDAINSDIYYFNISNPGSGSVLIPADERLALPPDVLALQAFPDVYERYVVFDEATTDSLVNRDIVLWDLETDTAIWKTVDPSRQERARIDGTRVVWEDSRNGNIDIYTYDIATGDMDPVTTDPNMQLLCAISDNRIVWTYLSPPNNFDIYMFELFGPPDADVSPTSLSFGDVEVGQSSLLIATISNNGESQLELTVTQTGSTDFTYTPTTAIVNPEESIDLTVTYTPSDIGPDEATLTINSNDPDEPTIEVTLTGNGVEAAVPPEEMFQELLDFYDENIENEDLQGIGPGNSPENREHAIRNMIVAASNLYSDGLVEEACEQLHDIYKKIDGEPNPPDFIVGDPPVLEELRQRILDLLEAFSCNCDS